MPQVGEETALSVGDRQELVAKMLSIALLNPLAGTRVIMCRLMGELRSIPIHFCGTNLLTMLTDVPNLKQTGKRQICLMSQTSVPQCREKL